MNTDVIRLEFKKHIFETFTFLSYLFITIIKININNSEIMSKGYLNEVLQITALYHQYLINLVSIKNISYTSMIFIGVLNTAYIPF